jgi:hypothetical protein
MKKSRNGLDAFDVQDVHEKTPRCPRVEEFPELGKTLMLVGEDELVTSREEIEIAFDYPLMRPTSLTFTSKGGFTLSKLWECVYDGYLAIYAREEQTSPTKVADIPRVIMNRPATLGDYGIYGHDIGDLYFEAFEEVKPGAFRLAIGS